jgi:glycosyltransferase involved in cell wall biosynthesis
VIDGETGRLFTPGRWDELARALGELLGDPLVRERIAARGRAKVELEYEIERCVQPLYERLSAEPGTRGEGR